MRPVRFGEVELDADTITGFEVWRLAGHQSWVVLALIGRQGSRKVESLDNQPAANEYRRQLERELAEHREAR